METTHHSSLLPALRETAEKLIKTFREIPDGRRELLEQFASLISENIKRGMNTDLNFICTHNSRRSQIGQLWAQAAAHYYSIPGIRAYSGGTEATAFNPRAVNATKAAGFGIEKRSAGDNPEYSVVFSTDAPAVTAFSKKYDHAFNPPKDFLAVMTCSHADENCPVVLGAAKKITLTYNDPKDFDDTPREEEKYRERLMEIGREILYAFSRVKWTKKKLHDGERTSHNQ